MSSVLSFLGWTFLPDIITSNLQSLYYNITVRAGSPKPQPGSPTFNTHRRRIYIGVIFAYLIYTLIEADWNVQREGDFYTLLGVPHDATDKQINRAFRKLSITHHPDKLPPNASPSDASTTRLTFEALTTAKTTLTTPSLRAAYDRFGPSITDPTWARLTTLPDLILAGLKSLVPFYTASAIGLWVSTWLGFLDSGGTYWRYLALATLGVVEAHAVTRPWNTGITLVPTLFNPWIRALSSIPGFGGWSHSVRSAYLPFQALVVAHRALVAFLIALSRLGPLFSGAGEGSGGGEEALMKQLTRLEQMVGVGAMESARMLALESVPFKTAELSSKEDGSQDAGSEAQHGDAASVAAVPRRLDPGLEKLKTKIKEWFVTNTVRQDPEVREAVDQLIERRANEANGDQEAYHRTVPAPFRVMQPRQRMQR